MNTAVAHDENDIYRRLDKCYAAISEHQAEITKLEADLQAIEVELEGISVERQQYECLSGVCENLEKLNEVGGNELFWSGIVQDDQIEDHLNRLRDKVSFFERRIKKVTDRRDGVVASINDRKINIAYLEDEIDYLKEQEEEAKYEYIVEREIKPIPYRVMVMPWTKKGEDEKKYRRILLLALLWSILLGLLIPMYTVPIPDRAEVTEIPERLAKLIKKPKPKPKPKKQPEVKKEEKKKPDEKERKEARDKVKNKGVLAFKNNFADLLDDADLEKLSANTNLNTSGSTARKTQRSILTSQAASSSGGINSSAVSRSVAGSGDQIQGVAFARVESAIGDAVEEDRPLSDGAGPSRTDEEIQIVFDKYKAALYRIYNRELRANPTLQGKVVLRITIEPNGTVSKCSVESTDMDSKALLSKIVARVKRFNFGAKEGVPQVTILYPIDFLPSS